MRRIFVFGFLLLVLDCPAAFSQEYPAVTLSGAYVRKIPSKFVMGMEYDLYIALPSGYEDGQSNYPVVYLLDGWDTFGIQLQTYQAMTLMDLVPPLILVGISYELKGASYSENLKRYFYLRSRDFTPTKLTLEEIVKKHGQRFADFVPVSGGGENFLRFLEEEIFPFIESEYRADPNDRGIFGYSLGGLFTTYVLLHKPTVFHRYFMGSPYLNWDDGVVFNLYEAVKFDKCKYPVKAYLSVGELEGRSNWERLKKFIEEKNHPKLQLSAEILPGETHLSGVGQAHSRAFRRLYGKK